VDADRDFAQSGHSQDTTATKPLQNRLPGQLCGGGEGHTPNTSGHSIDASEHEKCATDVLQECTDPDLSKLIKVWPHLPTDIRAAILREAGVL
jgi:hypothetical protein